MNSIIKEMELKLQDLAIEEGRDPQDASIKAEIAEWKAMKRKLAVIEKMSNAIGSRISELEKGFEEVIKEVDEHKAVVDGAIIEYVQKKGNKSVKYKEAVDYALKMVNEAQKKVLEEFIASVTKDGSITDVLAVTDPELEQYLLDLKGISGDDLLNKIETTSRASLDRFPKQVSNAKKRELKEGVVDNIAKIIKSLVSKFKRVMAPFYKSSDKAKKASEALVKAVKMDPLKEATGDKEDLLSRAESVYKAALQRASSPIDRAQAKEDYDDTVAKIKAGKDIKEEKISEREMPNKTSDKDHMGDTEFTSMLSWKGACRKVDSQVWFDGDAVKASAYVGPKPFKKGSTQEVGSFENGSGTVYGDAHLNESIKNMDDAIAVKKPSARLIAKLEKAKAEFRAVNDEIDAIMISGGKVPPSDKLQLKRKKLADTLKTINKDLGLNRN